MNNDDYNLLFSFYEANSKIKLIYNKHKSEINLTNFEEKEKKYFGNNLKKIEFFYNNIIASEDYNIKPNISIINSLLDLMQNKDIEVSEIIQYSKIQSINRQIKLIELYII